MTQHNEPPEFEPNSDFPDGRHSTLMLPSVPIERMDGAPNGIKTATDYVTVFEGAYKEVGISGIDTAVAKASPQKLPPSGMAYANIAFMPDPQSSGVIEWPGIQPAALKKIVKENVAPQMIIGMRCADVNRYSQLSTHIWKPGWKVEIMESWRAPTVEERKEILEAQRFLMNSCEDLALDKPQERDQRKLLSFENFLEAATRDTLTYAAIGLWTDTDNNGRVKAYALLPAGNIRLTGRTMPNGQFVMGGYQNDPDVFAVLVDDTKRVIATFTHEQFTFYIRNPRTDIDVFGYGYPEVEMAIRFVQGYQNALDMNVDVFNRSAVPNGILVLSGGQVTQKQLDLLNRMWTNLKKGVTKSWALPVMGLSENSKIEVLDLSRLKGNEAYYKDFMNMLAGGLATIFKFPVNRLGYRISGHGKDTEPTPDSTTNETDADDPGLTPLLNHLEGLINQYLIWSRWPTLRFSFYGKSPKEDSRSYEHRRSAMTLKEARGEADLRPLADDESLEGEEAKFIAQLMDAAPIDPNLAGVYQAIVGSIVSAKFGGKDAATPGNRMESKTDPAKAEEHGHTSGVRRDSAAESGKK